MATTSLIDHTLGLRGYRHLRTEYMGGAIYHHVELASDQRRCRGCGARWDELTLEGRFERTFRALPVGRRRQFIVLHGHEQLCRRCGLKLREPISFDQAKRRHIKAFERFIVDLCRIAPIKHVASWLGVSWTLVKDVFKKELRRRLGQRSVRSVRLIAVDELVLRKGHNSMTVALDLESGRILWAAEGRSMDALLPFLRKLKRVRAPLQAVAMDMWPASMFAVREVFPDVPIVHDSYHVVAMANSAIDRTRRDMDRRLQGTERKVLKGSRFLLLKGGERLDPSALTYLERLEGLNKPLYRAYLLKEDLRRFWHMPSKKAAKAFLGAWIARALASRLTHPYDRMSQEYRLVAYVRHTKRRGHAAASPA